jgi:hypothetical protein
LSTALLCAIHDAAVENTLFKDDDGTNTFRTFNPTQVFLHLKNKMLLTRCGARANMLVIILLHNGYLKKNIEIIIFLYHYIKIIQKHQKILI